MSHSQPECMALGKGRKVEYSVVLHLGNERVKVPLTNTVNTRGESYVWEERGIYCSAYKVLNSLSVWKKYFIKMFGIWVTLNNLFTMKRILFLKEMAVYLSYESAVELYTHLDEFCILLLFNYKRVIIILE